MKTFKKILTFVLALCMLLSVLSLTACKKEKNNKNENNDTSKTQTTDKTYTVTVVDGDNLPVAGVTIAAMIPTYQTFTTDVNGKVTFTSETSQVKAKIMNVPTGYDKPDNTDLNFASGSKELTVTISKTQSTTVECTVTVVDQNGDVVSGVTVQLCDNACVAKITDASGQATFTLKPGVEYKVEFTQVPAGYTAPTGYLEDKITGGTTSVTLEITKN